MLMHRGRQGGNARVFFLRIVFQFSSCWEFTSLEFSLFFFCKLSTENISCYRCVGHLFVLEIHAVGTCRHPIVIVFRTVFLKINSFKFQVEKRRIHHGDVER